MQERACSRAFAVWHITLKSSRDKLAPTGKTYVTAADRGGEVMLRLDDGWCAALDRNTMMCTIYEKRPLICREFEMGDVECLNERQDITTAYR